MRAIQREAGNLVSGQPCGPRHRQKGYPTRHGTWKRLVVGALFLALLPGCTSWSEYIHNGFKVGPNYRRPAAPVAEQWIDATDPAVSSSPANDAAWWQTFNDPTLNELVQVAYQQNLSLRVAGLRILEARAQLGIAVGGLFPQSQEASGGYTRIGTSKNGRQGAFGNRFYDDWNVGTSLGWELDFWGRFRRAIEAADANLDASIENYDDVLVLLLAEVAQRYIEIRTTEQRLEYAHKNVEIQKGSLRLADLKFRNGVTTRLDVTQGQSNLSQTEALIPPLEAAHRQATNQLCILLGIPPRKLEDVLHGPGKIPSAPAQVALGIPAELLRRRPDIRRAEREVAQQSAQIGIAQSELYPHFSITGSIALDATKFADLFDAGSFAGSVGPSFRWNILNYGRLVNNVRAQDARFQQLVVQYQQAVLQANAEAENAVVAFLKDQQQVKYLAESTTAAEQSVGLVQAQYDAGHSDFNRVLTVQQTLTQQQDQLAIAQGLVARDLVQLYKALGGGWQIRLAGPAAPRTVMNAEGEQEPTPAPPQTPPPAARP